MFDSLADRLGGVLTRLTRRGALSPSDVADAMREVRVALLEADVALPVVKEFIDKISAEAVGEKVIKSVTPGQMVVKIVHDALVTMLGGENEAGGLDFGAQPPVPVLMVGLQGSGKTTTTAKIANRLQIKDRKRVLMVSLDTYRPAAQEQLAILGRQVSVISLPIIAGQQPLEIAKRGLSEAKLGGFDVVMFDTAGRTTVDDKMMTEVAALRDLIKPHETLLVTDAMIGQDSVATAMAFHKTVGLTGIVLTRVDSDARGGAALSMRAVTGQPIKFIGLGEKVDAIDVFQPSRIAGRILGMGDVVSLVERATENIKQEDAEKLAARMMEGKFDLEDMLSQIRQMQKMGDLKGIMGMIPGLGAAAKQIAASKIDDNVVKRQEAIILSMTPKERRNPDLIKASRKQRIATGSGTGVSDVNKLLKQHQDMSGMMRRLKKMGGLGALGAMMGKGLPGMMPGMRGPGMGGGGPPIGRR
ncbi:MAG: signal recognition particle protein [Alphaproteobacteria bacterium]|nr:signal recognition particle protein [Alphaproteobacteria bacterium]PHY00942.1 MAG: signal recognition particle protein [Rhodospirillaceae bacterium]